MAQKISNILKKAGYNQDDALTIEAAVESYRRSEPGSAADVFARQTIQEAVEHNDQVVTRSSSGRGRSATDRRSRPAQLYASETFNDPGNPDRAEVSVAACVPGF